MPASVVAVHTKATHVFSKETRASINLVKGYGVTGDAHYGVTVKHRSRVARDPTQPNLRQVHLIHAELLDELLAMGKVVPPGHLGENVTTRGIDLLNLSQGTVLRIGETATIQVTGLRNPCAQIDSYMPGLLSAVLGKGPDGRLIRKTGVMGIVLESGTVVAGDPVCVVHVPGDHRPLEPV